MSWSTFWTALGAIGTVAASAAAFFTLRSLKGQIKVEQEPYVVVYDDVKREGSRGFRIKFKNVGRGTAISITGCTSSDIRRSNVAFFGDDQAHSKSLSAGERPSTWLVDESKIQQLDTNADNGETYKTFYLFYKSQLGKRYRSLIKLKVVNGDLYVVVACERTEV